MTRRRADTVIEGTILSRKSLGELIILAVILSFAVELVASSIIQAIPPYPLATFILGMMLAVASVLYFLRSLTGRRVIRRTFDGFFIYHHDTKKVVHVPRYNLSDRMHWYLDAAFQENPALKTQWEKEPLDEIESIEWSNHDAKPKSAQLVDEVLEYTLIEYLSTRLTDYFAQAGVRRDSLKEYRREDVPQVLLSNRFLELFSRPMEDRPGFNDEWGQEEEGLTVMADSSEGGYYSRFDLVLPVGTKVRRSTQGEIVIQTSSMEIKLKASFDGFNAFLPFEFKELYLGIDFEMPETHSVYRIAVYVEISTKLRTLLSGTSWEYYQWIDSFLEVVDENISQEAFLKRINWETAYTVHQMTMAGSG